jgi:hypothetical protein
VVRVVVRAEEEVDACHVLGRKLRRHEPAVQRRQEEIAADNRLSDTDEIPHLPQMDERDLAARKAKRAKAPHASAAGRGISRDCSSMLHLHSHAMTGEHGKYTILSDRRASVAISISSKSYFPLRATIVV